MVRGWLAGQLVDRSMDGEMSQCLPLTALHALFQLRAAEVEIKDLQSEFELEKIDYLATIRRQERDFMLLQQLLEQVQPLIRRDCNYSNLERIRRESCWDEDNGFWKIPEPVIIKTSLPVGQELLCPQPSLFLHTATLQTDREPEGTVRSESDRCGLEFCLHHSLCDLFGTRCPHL